VIDGYWSAVSVIAVCYISYMVYYRRTAHREEIERQKTLREAISEVERMKQRLDLDED